jgi:hypothetical protein
MNIKFIEVFGQGLGSSSKNYSLRTVYINPNHVVCLREDLDASRLLSEGHLPDELDSRQTFTCMSINKGTHGQDIILIGPVEEIQKKLQSHRQLLKG